VFHPVFHGTNDPSFTPVCPDLTDLVRHPVFHRVNEPSLLSVFPHTNEPSFTQFAPAIPTQFSTPFVAVLTNPIYDPIWRGPTYCRLNPQNRDTK
jgi:hypothetical protein